MPTASSAGYSTGVEVVTTASSAPRWMRTWIREAGGAVAASVTTPAWLDTPFGAELPEPATATLLLCGAAILAYRRFSRRRLD